MACLSWKPEHTHGFVVAANPIYVLSKYDVAPGSSIDFEIIEPDAELLQAHVGTVHVFSIDGTATFTARLGPLVSTVSTHPGLSHRRSQPTLRGRLARLIQPGEAATAS